MSEYEWMGTLYMCEVLYDDFVFYRLLWKLREREKKKKKNYFYSDILNARL